MTLGLDAYYAIIAYLRDEEGVDVMETVFMDENERFSALPHVLQRDVKAFFGPYARACTAADHLLFSVGKMEMIDRMKFECLTRQEERWGLYENALSIGTEDKWNQLLSEKGLRLSGHRLIRNPNLSQP